MPQAEGHLTCPAPLDVVADSVRGRTEQAIGKRVSGARRAARSLLVGG